MSADSALSASPGSAGLVDRPRPMAVSMMLAAAFGVTPMGDFGMPRARRKSSYHERHQPDREKTPEDLERIEAARQKRERKEAKRRKLLSQNAKD